MRVKISSVTGLREVNIIDVVIAEPDVEGDQLNNDSQVDQLTED
jgi:hypothetical protein